MTIKLKNIGWIATIFSLIGVFLNAYQIIWCWLIWIIANSIWIFWAVKKKEWAQVLLWTIFIFANLYGWYMWTIL